MDGGSGIPESTTDDDEATLLAQMTVRLSSDTASDPVTGAMLGMRLDATQDPMAAKTNAESSPEPTRPAPMKRRVKASSR